MRKRLLNISGAFVFADFRMTPTLEDVVFLIRFNIISGKPVILRSSRDSDVFRRVFGEDFFKY